MFLFTYTGFLLLMASLSFATFILIRKRKDLMARYFILYVYSVALWIGSNAFADIAKTPFSLIFLSGTALIGAVFVNSFYLCFIDVFINKAKPPLIRRFFYYLPSIIFSLGAFSKYSVLETIFPVGLPTQIVPGVFYTYFLYFNLLSAAYSTIIIFWFFFKKATKPERSQALLMWLGYVVLEAAMIFFVIILPLYFFEYRFYNAGPQFSILMMLLSSYAILRHRLFDLQLLIKKGAVFTLLFAAIFFLFNSIVTVAAQYVPGIASNLVATLIISIVFSPMKNWLEYATDKVFFRHHRSFDEVIRVLNEAMVASKTTDNFVEHLTDFIQYALKVDRMSLILLTDSGSYVAQKRRALGLHPLRLSSGSVILQSIQEKVKKGSVVLEVMEQDDLTYRINYENDSQQEKARLRGIQEELVTLGYRAVIPFIADNQVLGLFFTGDKLSGDRYSQTDFRVLNAVSHEGSITLDNAMHADRNNRLNELKNEFVGVVSHQLRTPLIAAKWNAELVLGKKLTPDLAEPIGDVQINLLKLNEGLNSMLTVLAIEQGKVEIKRAKTDITKNVVGSVMNEFKIQAAKKHVRILVKSKPKTVSANVDAEKIKKVMSILISNAILYTPENSSVEVSVVGDAKEIKVSVMDQGPGVSKKNRNEIFERFFRGAEAKKVSPDGLGVNLFIARDLVTRHGGKLWVEDRPDSESGALFVFTLPMR